jgi:hypothetical protein
MERNNICEAMKTLIDPKDYESVLAGWRGAQAKIWIFHVTHNRLAISLYRNGEQEALYIVAIGCEHIVGPFSWKEADVNIVTEPPAQQGMIHHRVVDKNAGFDLLCSGVAIARGPASVPESSFENFLGDAAG